MDATKRISELAAGGRPAAAIFQALLREKYRKADGSMYFLEDVEETMRAWRSKGRPVETEKSEPAANGTTAKELEKAEAPGASPPSGIAEKPGVSDPGPLPERWRREIINIVRREMSRTSERQTAQRFQTMELPPEPRKVRSEATGRPVEQGKRCKIAGTTDQALFDLLETWRTARGMNLSRAIDAVLWTFFGRPPLSFQKDEK